MMLTLIFEKRGAQIILKIITILNNNAVLLGIFLRGGYIFSCR